MYVSVCVCVCVCARARSTHAYSVEPVILVVTSCKFNLLKNPPKISDGSYT